MEVEKINCLVDEGGRRELIMNMISKMMMMMRCRRRRIRRRWSVKPGVKR